MLGAISFDLKILSCIMCLFPLTFYDNLLWSTLSIFMLLAIAYGLSFIIVHQRVLLLVAVYSVVFVYPVVSVTIMQTYACHEIEGISYLRADYSLVCTDSAWKDWACYASVWLAVFVVGVPMLMLSKLLDYRIKLKASLQNRDGSSDPRDLDFGFLLYDYRTDHPWACMWESEEMLRKLLLSTIGGFWETKSPLAIATALVISLVSLGLHIHVRPFRSAHSNLLQGCSLTVLALIYLCGLLLQTRSQANAQDRGTGAFLVTAVVVSLIGALGVTIRQFCSGYMQLRRVPHNFKLQYPGHVSPVRCLPCVLAVSHGNSRVHGKTCWIAAAQQNPTSTDCQRSPLDASFCPCTRSTSVGIIRIQAQDAAIASTFTVPKSWEAVIRLSNGVKTSRLPTTSIPKSFKSIFCLVRAGRILYGKQYSPICMCTISTHPQQLIDLAPTSITQGKLEWAKSDGRT
jgi:hypothetical protein